MTREIKELLSTKKEMQKHDPYLLPRKILLLSKETGATPAWNCKSGKDRTGILDAEIKLEMAKRELGSQDKSFMSSLETQKELFAKVLLHSGNREIQKKNTGIEGSKVLKRMAFLDLFIGKTHLREKIGDDRIVNITKGGAKIA